MMLGPCRIEPSGFGWPMEAASWACGPAKSGERQGRDYPVNYPKTLHPLGPDHRAPPHTQRQADLPLLHQRCRRLQERRPASVGTAPIGNSSLLLRAPEQVFNRDRIAASPSDYGGGLF